MPCHEVIPGVDILIDTPEGTRFYSGSSDFSRLRAGILNRECPLFADTQAAKSRLKSTPRQSSFQVDTGQGAT